MFIVVVYQILLFRLFIVCWNMIIFCNYEYLKNKKYYNTWLYFISKYISDNMAFCYVSFKYSGDKFKFTDGPMLLSHDTTGFLLQICLLLKK